MKVKFHTYNGLAGDPHLLLVGVNEDGTRVSRLFNRNFFRLWNIRQAKRKILKEFELLNGEKHIEHV